MEYKITEVTFYPEDTNDTGFVGQISGKIVALLDYREGPGVQNKPRKQRIYTALVELPE